MIAVLGLILGIILGVMMPVAISAQYSTYVAVLILAALNSVLGGAVADMKGKFNMTLFITGLLCNVAFGVGLTFIGDKLGIEVYLAAVFAFGSNMIRNISMIRRIAVEKISKAKKREERKVDVK